MIFGLIILIIVQIKSLHNHNKSKGISTLTLMPLFYNKNILKDFKFKIMKWSIYNISDQTKEDKTLLYNYFTDKIIVLLPELYNIVKNMTAMRMR